MHALFGSEVQWNREGNWAVSVEAALWVNTRFPLIADLFGFDRDGEESPPQPCPNLPPLPRAWGLTAQSYAAA